MIKFNKTRIVPFFLAAISLVVAAPPPEELHKVSADVQNVAVDPSQNTKGIPFELPAFLSQAKPFPAVFGNAAAQGEVGGLFAANNNTLISVAGPNNTAIASLNSTSFYFAKPINETSNSTNPDGTTLGTSLAGFTVTAQEDTHAYAEGDWIQFINHGGSYATGIGESQANGTTANGSGGTGPGWGWKGLPNEQNHQNLIPNPLPKQGQFISPSEKGASSKQV